VKKLIAKSREEEKINDVVFSFRLPGLTSFGV